jgi:hypothetical protein
MQISFKFISLSSTAKIRRGYFSFNPALLISPEEPSKRHSDVFLSDYSEDKKL